MNQIEDFLCFEFKEFILSAISSSGSTWGIKLGTTEILFVSVPYESFSLGFSTPRFSYFQFGHVGLDY